MGINHNYPRPLCGRCGYKQEFLDKSLIDDSDVEKVTWYCTNCRCWQDDYYIGGYLLQRSEWRDLRGSAKAR